MGVDRKTKMAARPLIRWDILDFFSETTERNSRKFDRKEDLNIRFQVYKKTRIARRSLIQNNDRNAVVEW